jgi:glutathione peroxidase-family protein
MFINLHSRGLLLLLEFLPRMFCLILLMLVGLNIILFPPFMVGLSTRSNGRESLTLWLIPLLNLPSPNNMPGLQELYDKYREAGFGMVAVTTDDFNQELDSDAEVKKFCELNYDIDMPMSETLSVRGQQAHPFFKAVKAQSGFAPTWNFNIILIGGNGEIIDTWGSLTSPLSTKLTRAIDDELSKPQEIWPQ